MAKKILIIDDEPAVVELWKARLKLQGFNVITASKGTEAVTKALGEKPDLLLLNIMMGGTLTGYQVFEKLQKDPHAKNIPVIVFSVRKNMRDLFPKQSKLITFLEKSINQEVLTGIVAQMLTLQKLEENKNVIILGIQEFVVRKMKEWFEKKGYKVTTPLNEYDAIQKCEMLAPKFFFCQFWGDPNVMDSPTVYKKVKYGSVAGKVNFYIYCPQDILDQAQKIFPVPMIIPYNDSNELLKKIEQNILR